MVLALSLDVVRNGLLAAVVVAVIVAVVGLLVVRWVLAKAVVLVVFAVIAFVLWNRRAELGTCADRVRTQVTQGQPAGSCTVFGHRVDLP